MIKVTVWNEFYHEKNNEKVRAIYPQGIHQTIADFLKCDDITVDNLHPNDLGQFSMAETIYPVVKHAVGK